MRRTEPPSPSLTALAFRQEGLLTSRQCDEAGVDANRRARLVRSGVWARAARGVIDTTPGNDRGVSAGRCRAAWLAALAYGPDAVVVGAGALALRRVSGLPTKIVPEVSVGPSRAVCPRAGIRVRYEATRWEAWGAIRVAPLLDALVQAVARLPRDNAVAVLDDVAHRNLLGPDVADQVRAALGRRRGAASARRWCALVDARAESPLETFARLDCRDAGLPPDDLQVTIRSSSGLVVARGDLGWRRDDGRWLLAEIDGREFHDTPAALYHDRVRQNRLVTEQVDVLRFTARDVAARGTVPRTVRSALDAARRRT